MAKDSVNLKNTLDDICDMLDTYGGRDKVRYTNKLLYIINKKKSPKKSRANKQYSHGFRLSHDEMNFVSEFVNFHLSHKTSFFGCHSPCIICNALIRRS